MNKELLEALNILEKEKEISKETLFEAIENSLTLAVFYLVVFGMLRAEHATRCV